MARTRSKQYPENRNLILDRAATLFAKLGFHRASISELARECNYSKASLYHYYDSKEEILFALLDQHLDELLALAQEARASSCEPVEQFRSFVRDSMKLYVRKVHHHTVLNRDIRYLPEHLREDIRVKERDLLNRLATLLKTIKPEMSSAPGSDKVYAMMFFGMLNWTYTWYHPEGPVGAEQFADMATDLYLNGLTNIKIPALAGNHLKQSAGTQDEFRSLAGTGLIGNSNK